MSKISNAPETLQQTQEIFRLMVESVQDYAIFLLDSSGNVVTWNAGAQHIKGYKADEIIGKNFSIFYGAEDKRSQKPELELKEAVEKGRYRESGWHYRKDGTAFWADYTITALFDKDHVLRGFSKVTRDMTEQRQAEELLRQSEERLRLMIEGVQDYAIYMLDQSGNVASWNLGAERFKQYKAKEIIGKNYSMFYTEEDRANNIPQRNLKIATETGHCIDEGWRVRKDGTKFWASVVITAMKDKQGVLRGFTKVTRDLTERKHAEDELERKVVERTQELLRINKELEQFAYVASHDLQEPLRMVATYVDLLSTRCSSKLNAEECDYINYAMEGAERAQQLIRELLDYSQIGTKETAKKQTDLNQLLEQVKGFMQLSLKESGAVIEAGPLPSLKIDPTQMSQLFQNLISNAVKYRSAEPPRIKITAQDSGNMWQFSFQDNGIGIAPEYFQRIFELFQRLHSKNKYPGTGLGLAICKKIVERHGGSIWVESQPGKGSTFIFTLPK